MYRLIHNPLRVAGVYEGHWREWSSAHVLIRDKQIACIGEQSVIDAYMRDHNIAQDSVAKLDASNCVLLPGFVNGHHHLYQTLTRALGTAQGLKLFDWLKLLYQVWAELTPESVYTSSKLGLAELLLTGCTTSADHLYLYPNGVRLEHSIQAAQELGIRFHPTRGSMSLGESQGGLPPDRIVEQEDRILEDSERLITTYHDGNSLSMLRIGLAPCSPFSVSPELMRQSATLARRYGVGLHTHLAETQDEEAFCLATFGYKPIDYMDHLGWLGDDVWFAHVVHPSIDDIHSLAHSGSGVCHCPSSNMILASGIAPVRTMLDTGVKVGLGVDGSASNDGNHMLLEARQAMLLQRVQGKADSLSAREALRLATAGGAAILGRSDIGTLDIGNAADLVLFHMNQAHYAGALHDPVAALVCCAPSQVYYSIINGDIVVDKGELVGVDTRALALEHHHHSTDMLRRAGVISS